MVIVKLQGGLGNQMFQYSYAKKLIENGYDVKLDNTEVILHNTHGGYQLDKYNIDIEVSSNEENKKYYKNSFFSKLLKRISFKNSNITKEKSLFFNEDLLRVNKDDYIDGYFQSENYFKEIRNIICEGFTVNKSYYEKFDKNMINMINSSKNSCSIHIRRGDYVTNRKANCYHGICSLKYYMQAVKLINSKFRNVSYYIFSDDIEWVRENIKIEDAIYIENNKDKIPHEDMYLMSLCKHNIIANSSFSWWGAWLNNNLEKTVIAPAIWFKNKNMQKQSKDLIPNNWIKID